MAVRRHRSSQDRAQKSVERYGCVCVEAGRTAAEHRGELKEIPYIDKLMGIKGIGLVTVSGFIAEWVTLDVLITPSSFRNLPDMQS